MVIDKIINNNIVSAFDEKGLEVVIMGRGIGFQMKRGQEVPAEKIEKVFRIKSQSHSRTAQGIAGEDAA